MSNLLAVDPGVRGCGIAYFRGPTLHFATYLRNPVEKGNGPTAWFGMADAVYFHFKELGYAVETFVLEVPQVYRVSKGDPNDLIDLAGVGGAIGASFPLKRAIGYKPREWKGTIKKEIHHPRILAQLSPAELECIAEKRKTYVHNVTDAIGIGLFFLERERVRMSK